MGNELPTIEEFLELAKVSAHKHEYVSGTIRALAGASLTRNEIVVNLTTRLHTVAGDGPCRVYVLDPKPRRRRRHLLLRLEAARGQKGDHPLLEEAPCRA